jgi:uncharacterized membrane protein
MVPMRAALLALFVCGCSTVGEYYHERAWNTSGLPAGIEFARKVLPGAEK